MSELDFDKIMASLAEYYTPEEAVLWMNSVHPQLGCSPIEALRQGRVHEVAAIMNRLDSGAYL